MAGGAVVGRFLGQQFRRGQLAFNQYRRAAGVPRGADIGHAVADKPDVRPGFDAAACQGVAHGFNIRLVARRIAGAVPDAVTPLTGVSDESVAIWQAEARRVDIPAESGTPGHKRPRQREMLLDVA